MTKQITLKNLRYATKQQIFDQVAAHLLKQKVRSTKNDDETWCMYRGPDGLKCAAGCLIADDEYSEGMENNTWADLVKMRAINGRNAEFITQLQLIHDGQEGHRWAELLKSLAGKHKLKCNFED